MLKRVGKVVTFVLPVITFIIVIILAVLVLSSSGSDDDDEQQAINNQLEDDIAQNADRNRKLAQQTIPELDAIKKRLQVVEEDAKDDTRVQTLEEDLAAVNDRSESYHTQLTQEVGTKASTKSVDSRLAFIENKLNSINQSMLQKLGTKASELSVVTRLTELDKRFKTVNHSDNVSMVKKITALDSKFTQLLQRHHRH